jgi:hypothetical protein
LLPSSEESVTAGRAVQCWLNGIFHLALAQNRMTNLGEPFSVKTWKMARNGGAPTYSDLSNYTVLRDEKKVKE